MLIKHVFSRQFFEKFPDFSGEYAHRRGRYQETGISVKFRKTKFKTWVKAGKNGIILRATLSIVSVVIISLWFHFINTVAKLKTMPGIAAVLRKPQNQKLWVRHSTLHFTDRCGRTPDTCLCFVLFYVLSVLCRSVCWLCVYVYCTTATGCLPNCS